MNPQQSYVSSSNMAQGMEKRESFGGQSNYVPEQSYPPLNDETTRLDHHGPPNYQSSVVQQNDSNFDPECVKGFDFNDESIRRNFIRKVFTLLSMQLVITFVLVFLISHPNGMRNYMFEHVWIYFVGIIALIITLLTISCSEGIRRTYPTNLIFLGILTVCEGICIGYIAALYDTDVVMTAFGLTIIMIMALSLFAVQTKYDFTKYNCALFVALLMFTIAILISAITWNHILDLILSCIGVILFSIYLIHDIQLIIGGEHKYQLNPEEYILATLILYLDVVRIFRHLMRIVSVFKRK